MWILKKEDNNFDACFFLPCGDLLKVGRSQGSNITLLNDRSVSRDHASIFVIHDDKNLNCENRVPEVILQDLSSTYGTYVNDGISDNMRISSNNPQHLRDKDKIRFGIMNNVFVLTYEPLIVTSSQLVSQEQLQKDLMYLGGHLVKEWSLKCSLLTMQELKLTIKTVAALAAGSYIVTPNYFQDMVHAIKFRLNLPDPSLYLPQLKEPSINGSLVSFNPDPIRKSLFSGKTFLFQKKVSFKKMRTVIKLSGGQPIELLETNFHKVIESNNILVKSSEKENDPLPSAVVEAFHLLEQKGLVAIPESDIGLAILYKNIEKYCNPNFKITAILQSTINNQPKITTPLHIFATETQDDSLSIPISKIDLPSTFISRTTIIETGGSTRNDQCKAPKVVEYTGPNRNASITSSLKTSSCVEHPSYSNDDTVISTNMSEVSNEQVDVKENIAKRKRDQLSCDNSVPLISKRRSLLSNKKLEKNEAFQFADDLIEKSIPRAMDLDADTFLPPHFSTEELSFVQKENSSICEKIELNSNSTEVNKTCKSNIRETSSMLNSSKESESCLMSDNERVAKSIPFDPYTLPSLEFHENVSKELQVENAAQVVIKNELHCPTMSSLRNKIDIPDNWVGKREIEENIQKDMKKQRLSPSPNKACCDDKNLFAVPFPSTRQRRKAKEITNMGIKHNEQLKSREINLTTDSAADGNNIIIKKEPNLLNESCEKKNIVKANVISSFIEKETCTLGHEQNLAGKTDDVSKLSETLEKSLMVVEVVSLIRTTVLSNAAVNKTSLGLTNFKKFKKVSSANQIGKVFSRDDSSAFPKIIGGCDLIAHSAANNRREEFLASQTTENSSENEEVVHQISKDFDLDPAFLQPFPNTSRRRRMR